MSLALSDDDVSEILRIIDESQLDELTIETPSFSLHVTRGGGSPQRGAGPAPDPPPPTPPPPPPPPTAPPPPLPPTAPPPPPTPPSADTDTVEIEAPMLGTFYRTESPAHPPFVVVGDRVAADTVVCLIEVMKLMNHIQSGVAGTIVEVLAQSGELVEFGQPLFRVAPERA